MEDTGESSGSRRTPRKLKRQYDVNHQSPEAEDEDGVNKVPPDNLDGAEEPTEPLDLSRRLPEETKGGGVGSSTNRSSLEGSNGSLRRTLRPLDNNEPRLTPGSLDILQRVAGGPYHPSTSPMVPHYHPPRPQGNHPRNNFAHHDPPLFPVVSHIYERMWAASPKVPGIQNLEQTTLEELEIKVKYFHDTFLISLCTARTEYLKRKPDVLPTLTWYEAAMVAMSEVNNVFPDDYVEFGKRRYDVFPFTDFRHPFGRFDTLVRTAKWIVEGGVVVDLQRFHSHQQLLNAEINYFPTHGEIRSVLEREVTVNNVLSLMKDSKWKPYVLRLLGFLYVESEVPDAYGHILSLLQNLPP